MQKYAVVTGAVSGFGFEIVQMLLRQNWHVFATLKSPEEQSDFEAHPHLTLGVMDLTDKDQITACVEQIHSQLPQVDLLINNAGFGLYGALEDISEPQLRHQMEVNFFGPVLFTRALLPLLRHSQGRVITVTSIMAQYSMPLVEAYSASKYALEGMFEALYYEMQPFGVQVCTVQPGGYRTAFFKSLNWAEHSASEHSPFAPWRMQFQTFMDKLAQRPKGPHPREVAQKVAWLLKQKKMPRSVVVGKDALLIATLRRTLPAPMFHALIQRLNRKVMGF